jgi:tRNA uridine 5-carboxymethylaminomethyl modification enzyme
MYSGQIQSTGPRYCPSIEDKVVRFSEKESHQLFLEPEGRNTHEVYINGVSTSLPRDVQDQMIRQIVGLEKAQIMRYGYAVEYDFCPPDQLKPSLETKTVAGLFFAGQLNGTTGYEEAAAQGLMAGANASLRVAQREPFVMSRDQGYIGVLIDDLVTRSVDEPYRMFTSRAEYRLLLRYDNADQRLTPVAHELGLVDQQRWDAYQAKMNAVASAVAALKALRVGDVHGDKYLKRPEVTWQSLASEFPALQPYSAKVGQLVEHDTKYAGYVARQQVQVDRQERMAKKRIPDWFDYNQILSLRFEAKQKLAKIRPASIDQATRISGITPADIALVLAHLEKPSRS